MKIHRATVSGLSLVLLAVQAVLVCTVVASYAWQRHHYPRVWTRAYGYDPQLPLRGRYLSLQVSIDGCSSTLPSAKQALFQRDFTGAVKPGPYAIQPVPNVQFSASLQVVNGQLQAVFLSNEEQRRFGQIVQAQPEKPCQQMLLRAPVNFYIADIHVSRLSRENDGALGRAVESARCIDQDRSLRTSASRLMVPACQQDRTSICCLRLRRAFAED